MYKRIKSIIGLGLMFSLLLFVIACNSDSPQSTFDPHGPIAELQKNLFMFTFWIAVVVFIIVEGGIIYLTFKYHSFPKIPYRHLNHNCDHPHIRSNEPALKSTHTHTHTRETQ